MTLSILLVVTLVGSTAVAEPQGVLFHASFDYWLTADVAPGGRSPVKRVGCTLKPGKFGRALALDGRSYLEFPAAGNVGRTAGTVCLWFRPEHWGEKTYDNIFGLSDSNVNALHLERFNPSGRLRLILGGPKSRDGSMTQSLFSPNPLRDGEWVHVAAAWDGERRRAELFVNGKSVARTDKPGPLPVSPPAILVGCGFGRLGRAVRGLIDDLFILDHAASAAEVQALMRAGGKEHRMKEFRNDALCVVVDPDQGTVTVGDQKQGGRLILGPARLQVMAAGRETTCVRFDSEESTTPTAPRLGAAVHHVFRGQGEQPPLEFRLHVQVERDEPLALFWAEVKNLGRKPISVDQIDVIHTPAEEGFALGIPANRFRVFLDSGRLTGSGVREFARPGATHAAHGALALHDLGSDFAASFGFVSFRVAEVTTSLSLDDHGAPAAALARCRYPHGRPLAPGETMTSQIVSVGYYANGHQALEKWADTVMAVNDLQPPRFRPTGYNSWYAYRLEISEDLVLENARIMKKRWPSLGLEYVQIDHGWQDRDIVGHWVPNQRFPHGLPWLSRKLEALGYHLGLWLSATNISEFAPFFTEHPEALMHNPDGSPVVSAARWYWPPHGKTYSLDPTHPVGAKFFEETGRALWNYGCRYAKNDFQTNLMNENAVLHDNRLVHGVPVYRLGMNLLRKGMGPEMAYHACNGMLNVIAGECDVAWTHRDMGNPRGDWAALRLWVNEFCCRYHVSGKFYWSDPDYLQVGQGTPDETRVRMAICALGGGPVTLCDRLPELSEEKLALIPKCLPGYGRPSRPVDLFTHLGYPRVWDLPVDTPWGSWHVVGVFNLDEEPARIEIPLDSLNLEPGRRYVVYDFFAQKLLGEVTAGADLDLAVRVPTPATSVRVLRLTPVQPHPFVLSTDMHLTQGGVELAKVKWDRKSLTLRGTAHRAPGMTGRVLVYVPSGYAPVADAGEFSPPVLSVSVSFAQADQPWAVRFTRRAAPIAR